MAGGNGEREGLVFVLVCVRVCARVCVRLSWEGGVLLVLLVVTAGM